MKNNSERMPVKPLSGAADSKERQLAAIITEQSRTIRELRSQLERSEEELQAAREGNSFLIQHLPFMVKSEADRLLLQKLAERAAARMAERELARQNSIKTKVSGLLQHGFTYAGAALAKVVELSGKDIPYDPVLGYIPQNQEK